MILVPVASQLFVSRAAMGSAMAAKTMGVELVAAIMVWAEGVEMATMASGLSPTNLRAIWAAVAVLPWALWYCQRKFVPSM